MSRTSTSRFQDVLETVESLPPEDQEMLVDVLRHRLSQRRRTPVIADVAESRDAFKHGEVRRGTSADLMAEIGE
jgi:hypothetical protein